MLMAKLIAPENRMRQMSDDHAHPNIDLEYVGAEGHVIDEMPRGEEAAGPASPTAAQTLEAMVIE